MRVGVGLHLCFGLLRLTQNSPKRSLVSLPVGQVGQFQAAIEPLPEHRVSRQRSRQRLGHRARIGAGVQSEHQDWHPHRPLRQPGDAG